MPKMKLALHVRKSIVVTICPIYRFMLIGRRKAFQDSIYDTNEVRRLEGEFLYRCSSCRSLLHSGYGCEHIELADSPYWNLKCDFWDGYHFICSTSDRLHFKAHLINETLIFLMKYVISSASKRKAMEHCFRDIWRIYRHPYIRIQEIKSLFKFEDCFGKCPQKCMEYIHFSCQVYEECFSEFSLGPVMPRSLKHLSRCEVRIALMKSKSWPIGTEVLGLPRQVKEYLQLRC